MEPSIIYEDKNFLAINKPAGLLVHGIKNKSSESTLVDWLIKYYPNLRYVGDNPEERPGIVHRLDKDTSGIMLIAKNQDYFNYLKSLFQRGEIKKKYLAIVFGQPFPKQGTINKPLGIKAGTVKRTVFGGKKIQKAETYYKVLQNFGDFSLLEARPKTGRTHQIRAHLASIGFPIIGDSLYGHKKKIFLSVCRQLLHAYSLEFNLSVGKRIWLAAELPPDFKKIIQKLKMTIKG